jgi:hypothetical protein
MIRCFASADLSSYFDQHFPHFILIRILELYLLYLICLAERQSRLN